MVLEELARPAMCLTSHNATKWLWTMNRRLALTKEMVADAIVAAISTVHVDATIRLISGFKQHYFKVECERR